MLGCVIVRRKGGYMQEKISLLWKNMRQGVAVSSDAIKDLDIAYIVEMVSKNDTEKKWILEILQCICTDRETIQYRAEIFDDFIKDQELRRNLADIVGELKVLKEIQNSRISVVDYSCVWQLINRLKELYSYIVCIEKLKECLQKAKPQSEGLQQLSKLVNKVYTGSGFEYLKQDVDRLTEDVSKLKSLTLGVNLDGDLNPVEVQLISINKTKYKDEDSSILKSFASVFAGTFATSVVQGNQHEIDPLMNALTKRVDELLHVTVEDLRVTLNKYVDISGYQVTKLIPELIYYLRFAEITKKLCKCGLPMTKAIMQDEEKEDIQEFYNIKLGLFDLDKSGDQDIVKNNLHFNEHHREYILTGPNMGGKTILTQGIGLLYLFAQNGLYVPAKKACLRPVDHIFTHFPADENTTVELGRLGEESKRVHDIIENATANSLILLNESFSTTSFSEGLYIAKDVVKAFNYLKARVIYNTHMHELAAEAIEMNVDYNETTGKSVVDSIKSLVMGIEGGRRNYVVQIASPTGSSYANDIARKYGIDFNNLKSEIDKKVYKAV